MERELFDHVAAQTKIGRPVRTTVEFSGVPRGTRGRVIRADRANGGYTLGIEWDLPERRATPLVDWFTRGEYERFLVEL